MKRNKSLIPVLAFCMVLTGFVAFAEEAKQETYSCTIADVPGRPTTLSAKIYITSYTTDEEVAQYANILKSQGPDALLKAITKTERGRISPAGRTGSRVGVVRSKPAENGGRRVTMLMDRPVSFAELWKSTRSTDYPFGILQMELDSEGKGSGQLMVAAKIQFKDDKTIEVENFGIHPLRLMAINKLK